MHQTPTLVSLVSLSFTLSVSLSLSVSLVSALWSWSGGAR